MKDVFIDNRQRLVVMDGKEMPRLLLGIIRGTIGKCFVVKHYRANKQKKWKKRIIVTRYPDMSGIVASEKQRVRRDLFKEAVVYAKWIISDVERKKAFRKALPRKKRKHVYQAAIRMYMSRQGDKQWLRKQLAVRGMMSSGRKEIGDVRVEKGVHGELSMVNAGGFHRINGAMKGVHGDGVSGRNRQWSVRNVKIKADGNEHQGRWKLVWQKKGSLLRR